MYTPDQLREALRARPTGCTLREIADVADLSISCLEKIANGTRRQLRYETVVSLGAALEKMGLLSPWNSKP